MARAWLKDSWPPEPHWVSMRCFLAGRGRGHRDVADWKEWLAAPLPRETCPVLYRGMSFFTEAERNSVDVKSKHSQPQCSHWSTSRDVALSFTVGWEWEGMEAHIKKFGLLLTAKNVPASSVVLHWQWIANTKLYSLCVRQQEVVLKPGSVTLDSVDKVLFTGSFCKPAYRLQPV